MTKMATLNSVLWRCGVDGLGHQRQVDGQIGRFFGASDRGCGASCCRARACEGREGADRGGVREVARRRNHRCGDHDGRHGNHGARCDARCRARLVGQGVGGFWRVVSSVEFCADRRIVDSVASLGRCDGSDFVVRATRLDGGLSLRLDGHLGEAVGHQDAAVQLRLTCWLYIMIRARGGVSGSECAKYCVAKSLRAELSPARKALAKDRFNLLSWQRKSPKGVSDLHAPCIELFLWDDNNLCVLQK